MHKYLVAKIQDAYPTSKVLLVYFLLFTAYISRINPQQFGIDPQIASNTAVLAMGILILPFLFEIHKTTTKMKKETVFQNILDARLQIEQEVNNKIQRGRPVSISCIGVTLAYQWPFIEQLILRLLQEDRKQISITIVILDPDWKDVGEFNQSWPKQVQGSLQGMRSTFQSKDSILSELEWSVEIYGYKYMPLHFGLLLDEEVLFLGTTYWDDGGNLKAAQNIIEEHLDSDHPLGHERIKEFLGWLKYSKQRELFKSSNL